MSKKLIMFALVAVFAAGCAGMNATTSSAYIKKGSKKEFRKIKTVKLESFESNGPPLATTAIRNSIVGSFLPSGITIVEEGEADAVIKGTITFTADSLSSSSGAITSSFGATSSLSSAGGYVSGITAQVVRGGVIASVMVTQVRMPRWIPDPAEVMGMKVGKKLVRIMTLTFP